jgi:hypothetical protein
LASPQASLAVANLAQDLAASRLAVSRNQLFVMGSYTLGRLGFSASTNVSLDDGGAVTNIGFNAPFVYRSRFSAGATIFTGGPRSMSGAAPFSNVVRASLSRPF